MICTFRKSLFSSVISYCYCASIHYNCVLFVQSQWNSMLVFIDCVHCHSVMFVHLNKLECVNVRPLKQVGMCEYASCLAFFFCIYHYSVYYGIVFLFWKLYWSCSAFEMIICCTRFLSTKFGHSDYITLTFKVEFVCPTCSDFITSSYLNAPEALKLHTHGFSLYYYDIHCVHCYKHPHLTWPQFWCHKHTLGSKPFFLWWK